MSVKTFSTEVLTSADTNTYLANSGLVYVTSATIGSGVSSVTVSSAFSTIYDNYKIHITGGVASASPDLQVQLGSTVTTYYYTSLYNRYNASTATGLASANQTSWRYSGSGTTSLLQADIELFNPFLTKVTLLKANMNQYAVDGLSMFTQGFLDNSTSYTAFTISPTAGTITGGTITVYGYRKA